jgi:hypothetical protein
MGLDFNHVFSGISMGGPHDGIENLINGLLRLGINDISVVEVV